MSSLWRAEELGSQVVTQGNRMLVSCNSLRSLHAALNLQSKISNLEMNVRSSLWFLQRLNKLRRSRQKCTSVEPFRKYRLMFLKQVNFLVSIHEGFTAQGPHFVLQLSIPEPADTSDLHAITCFTQPFDQSAPCLASRSLPLAVHNCGGGAGFSEERPCVCQAGPPPHPHPT